VFTDQPTTPTRIEALIDLLRESNANRKFTRTTLYRTLQPEALPGVTADASAKQAIETLRASIELVLVDEQKDGVIRLAFKRSDPRSTRQIVLDALDERILGSVAVEPYFGPFYSYLLFLGPSGARERTADEWAIAFERDVYSGERQPNPFNKVKYTGLHRWYCYAGLGWEDTGGVFQPNPYERISRALGRIFRGKKQLSGDEFMAQLALACPEVDGGEIFLAANSSYQAGHRTCTLGLSQALIELHEDGAIVLSCPRDSHGWSLASAQPVYDGRSLVSDRIDSVRLLLEGV